ncbi:hypothetical protein CLOM_g8392 [Closterium sp. NIES-68]|nr:hypothetical protein CLOM_g8392 [Closterium sp. NIES-68]GJP85231.1 hypothetical protein CLOP_g15356 [Closterium sp. NIES-67]
MKYTPLSVLKSLALFVAAGLLEIGGGWFVWQWRINGWHWAWCLLGAAILFGYGLVATFQDASFARTYAAYGGIFILLALLWGWAVDRTAPDVWDLVGAAVAVGGACIIMFVPRPADGA